MSSIFSRTKRKFEQAKPEPGEPSVAPWEMDFPPAATEDDILACFRLLLGRRPGSNEWPGHAARIGEELAPVVSTYLNSQEFTNRNLISRGLGQWQLVNLPHCKMFASPEDTFIGGVLINTGSYEPHITKVFREHLRPGMHVLDIGANIGYFSLLAAFIVGPAGFVQCWEPSATNVRALYASQVANGFRNIEVIQAAATDTPRLLNYFRANSNGNVADVQSARPEDILASETVMGLRIDDCVSPDTPLNFVKIDVEGHEFKALTGALKTLQRTRPVIVSEFSPDSLANASGISGRQYLDFFAELGYGVSVITHDAVAAGSIEDALLRYEQNGTDHIDLLLTPAPRGL